MCSFLPAYKWRTSPPHQFQAVCHQKRPQKRQTKELPGEVCHVYSSSTHTYSFLLYEREKGVCVEPARGFSGGSGTNIPTARTKNAVNAATAVVSIINSSLYLFHARCNNQHSRTAQYYRDGTVHQGTRSRRTFSWYLSAECHWMPVVATELNCVPPVYFIFLFRYADYIC